MLRHILEDISPELEVFDFGDSEEALRWSENNRPDLLLLDYRMPVIDGLESVSYTHLDVYKRQRSNRSSPT